MDLKPVLSQDSQVKVTSREPGLEPVIVKIIPHNWQPRQHLPKLNLSAKPRQQDQNPEIKLFTFSLRASFSLFLFCEARGDL